MLEFLNRFMESLKEWYEGTPYPIQQDSVAEMQQLKREETFINTHPDLPELDPNHPYRYQRSRYAYFLGHYFLEKKNYSKAIHYFSAAGQNSAYGELAQRYQDFAQDNLTFYLNITKGAAMPSDVGNNDSGTINSDPTTSNAASSSTTPSRLPIHLVDFRKKINNAPYPDKTSHFYAIIEKLIKEQEAKLPKKEPFFGKYAWRTRRADLVEFRQELAKAKESLCDVRLLQLCRFVAHQELDFLFGFRDLPLILRTVLDDIETNEIAYNERGTRTYEELETQNRALTIENQVLQTEKKSLSDTLAAERVAFEKKMDDKIADLSSKITEQDKKIEEIRNEGIARTRESHTAQKEAKENKAKARKFDSMTSVRTKDVFFKAQKPDVETMSPWICPISQELMTDPVVAEDGHSYQRESIQTYFDGKKGQSKVSSPILMTSMGKTLRPNMALRHTIEQFLQESEDAKQVAEEQPVPAVKLVV